MRIATSQHNDNNQNYNSYLVNDNYSHNPVELTTILLLICYFATFNIENRSF